MIFALFFVAFLCRESQTASGLSSIDVALKWVALKSPMINTHKADSVKKLNMKNMNLAPTSAAMKFDPNQSNKRGVKKGSDPIHNRS